MILNGQFEEVKVDRELARTLNPVAFWQDKIIIFHRAQFAVFRPETGEKQNLAKFVPVHSMTPLAKVEGGYEFIASYREPNWPTFLQKLIVPEKEGEEGSVEVLARAEDPVISRQFLRLSEAYYMLVPSGKPIFLIFKVFPGSESSIRTWVLVPIPAGARPVGLVREGGSIYAACADSLCTFELSDEFGIGQATTE